MIQTIIDLIRGKKIFTFDLRENVFYDAHYKDKFNGCYINYLKLKCFESKISKLETLILGSSHGVYAYLPVNNEFNLCFPSQDLYYSLKLYEKYRLKLQNLNKIYLFYSVFSPGFELYEASEKWRCVYYKKFFSINSPNKTVNILSDLLIKKLEKKMDKICFDIDISEDYYGENIDLDGVCTSKYDKNYTAKKRALDHFRNNVRSNNSHKYLIEFAKLVKQDGRQLCIIIPPMHEDFRKWLTSDKFLFEDLYRISANEGIKIFNYYNDSTFTTFDFFDFDHLNFAGAEKLTSLIHKQCV